MGRIGARAAALAFPWWTRTMKAGTALLAAAFVAVQMPGVPVPFGLPSAVGESARSVDVFPALAAAVAVTSALKALGLAVRVPLSLYAYPDD
ncbi:MAG: hypothetical protein ABEH40_02040 [Haloferacaceae archaeon]